MKNLDAFPIFKKYPYILWETSFSNGIFWIKGELNKKEAYRGIDVDNGQLDGFVKAIEEVARELQSHFIDFTNVGLNK